MEATNNLLLLPQDMKEIARCEARRQREELRKKRIFNPKQRLIGVDATALHKQVEEKTANKRLKEIEDKRQHLLQIDSANEAIMRQHFIEKEKRMQRQAINSFRQLHQTKQSRRDYDLEEGVTPYPETIGDSDCRFGVTVFDGEDTNIKTRTKIQKQQQRDWLIQQMKEREYVNQVLHKADKTIAEALQVRDQTAVNLSQMEQKCRREIERCNFEYNKASANQKAMEKLKYQQELIKMNEMEMYNTATSDFLIETPDRAKSSLGPHRFNTMMYKGMSEEEKKEIKLCQIQQIAEAKAKKTAESLEEKRWSDFSKNLREAISSADLQKKREMRDLTVNMKHYNKLLEKEQKARERYMDTVVYTNEATPEFFNQFNTGTR